VLIKLLSREQEYFNFSPAMNKAFYTYLRLSNFMNYFIKKAAGMITVKDTLCRKTTTVSQQIMNIILDKDWKLPKRDSDEYAEDFDLDNVPIKRLSLSSLI
jgi:hypothetical protein